MADQPPSALAIEEIRTAVELLAEADTHPFASPEYDDLVRQAVPHLSKAETLLREDGGLPDLLDQVESALDKLNIYLFTDWPPADEIETSEETTVTEHAHTDHAALLADGCLPCQLAREESTRRRDEILRAVDDTEHPTWSGPIAFEGQLTGDGRLIEPEALRWNVSVENPVPIRFVRADVGAHDGAEVVGRMFAIERRDNGLIWASGDFDLGSESGREAYRQVREDLTTGVSIDLDEVAFEVRVAADALDMMLTPSENQQAAIRKDGDGRVTVMDVSPDDEIRVITGARVRAVTLVAVPAFAEARITLDDSLDRPAVLAASAAPVRPPLAWFADPHLKEPTPLHVTEDGQVYGHLATWDTCHIANPSGLGKCVPPPHSVSNYAYFRTGEIAAARESGAVEFVSVGQITLDTRHAGQNASALDALSHYEHTGTAVADIAAGEDAFGIWVAGALRPSVTEEQIRVLRASPMSGDWRRVGGSLELVAALCVNVPGYPIPRPAGLVASIDDSGPRMVSLIASGMLPPRRVIDPRVDPEHALSLDDLRYLKRLAQRERSADAATIAARIGHVPIAERAEALRARVHAASATTTAFTANTTTLKD